MEITRIGVGRKTLLTKQEEILKAYALFFDKVVIVGRQLHLDHKGEIFEFLRDKHFLMESQSVMPPTPDEVGGMSDEDQALYRRACAEYLNLQDLTKAELYKTRLDERGVPIFSELTKPSAGGSSDLDRILAYGKLWESANARQIALALRLVRRTDAVCIGDVVGAQLSANVDHKATSDDVYKILVEGIPFPDSTVPWEDVLAFRSEPKSEQQLRDLRKWVRDTAQGNLTVKDAIDEINRLKGEYRLHIRGTGIRAVIGSVEAIIVGGLAWWEGAVPRVVNNAFKLLRIPCELLEAERKGEGRELAYIVRAENTFASEA